MSNKCGKSSSKKKHNGWWKWLLCGFVSFVVGVIVVCISLFLVAYYIGEEQDEMLKKPVIYLYPEEKTNVDVSLDLKDGKLTSVYPKYYKDGWHITAESDGTLYDSDGQSYNYLYWEAEANIDFDFSTGYCVEGSDTATFLEEKLLDLGLTRKEANEFIVYWLPQMERNSYNIISFQTNTYTDSAKLTVNPKSDTLIRVYMAYYGSDKAVNIAEPKKEETPNRNGFTVVEWGGSEVCRSDR